MPGNDAFTKIMLHMDGSNGGTTFTDDNAGGGAHTWTPHTATTNTGTVKFGTASMNAGAAVGWIDTPDSADFTLGSGDWTVDCWINPQSAATNQYFFGQGDVTASAASLSVSARYLTTGVFDAHAAVGSVDTSVTTTTNVGTASWVHFALVRTGNILKCFVNGTQEGGDVALTGTVNDSTNNFSVGRNGQFPNTTFNGFIDEFRLSVGIARWTANFTPPTAPYDTSQLQSTYNPWNQRMGILNS